MIQEGKEAGQGVGFLDDGTMIVVEGGAAFIERSRCLRQRVLQTVAGRMIFGQPRSTDNQLPGRAADAVIVAAGSSRRMAGVD